MSSMNLIAKYCNITITQKTCLSELVHGETVFIVDKQIIDLKSELASLKAFLLSKFPDM